MIQRDGLVNAKVTKDITALTLSAFIKKYIQSDSTIHTDENPAYNQIGKKYLRCIVDHSKHLYSYGNVTSNRIEGGVGHTSNV